MKKIALFTLIICSLFFISCNATKKEDGMYAKIITNKGDILLSLTYDKTPLTVANFIGLAEGTMNGTLIIDGSWDADLLDEPIELKVEDGLVVVVKGGTEAAQIRSAFGEVAAKLKPKEQESVWTVAEFGFGMNPAARLSGNVLEDEKKLGTCYFSIGDNSALGGSVNVGIRFTGVLAEPSLWINDTQVLEDGDFLL